MVDKNASTRAGASASKDAAADPTHEAETLRFEAALEALEATVERLERGELTLDQALDSYAEGTRLVHRCQQTLDAAEARLQALRGETGSTLAETATPRATTTPSGDDDVPF